MSIGSAAIGSGPFGVGTPLPADVPPTGTPTFSRYINPGSRQLEIDADTGHFKQMPSLRQRVLIILNSVPGSSTVHSLGPRYPKKLGDSAEALIKAAVRQAFFRLTNVERVMRIDSILVSRERTPAGRVNLILAYTDLTTGQGATASTA